MKTIIHYLKEHYIPVIIVFVIGGLIGWIVLPSPGGSAMSAGETEIHEGHDQGEEEPTTWTCSMHPQIKQQEPGDCPICGMDLIPLSRMDAAGEHIDPNEIMLSESAAGLADIETSVVRRDVPEKTVRLQGKIMPDERRISELTARFGGRIEKLFINFTGARVQKGEKLATLYSPELVTAQRELLEALSMKASRPALYSAARAKLKLWDLSDAQIDAIEKEGEPQLYFDVLSPLSGTVMERHVSVGDYVKSGDKLFMVTDLSHVWVMFDAYESDLPWIRVGDSLEYSVRSLPGERFEGKVAYIDPFLDPATRSVKVRVEQSNPDGKLKPEMFTEGILRSKAPAGSGALLIPRAAVLWTGKRSVVYVKIPDREAPSFLYREIELGPDAGNYYIVADGLEEGEVIATNGVFKIDAAAQLEGKRSMMNPEGGSSGTGHDHGSMATDAEDEPAAGLSAPVEFRKQLTAFYQAYIEMKDAFVETNAGKVQEEAGPVSKALNSIGMKMLDDPEHTYWMEQQQVLSRTLNTILGSGDIEVQRKAFIDFNLAFYKTIKVFGLEGVETYYQYCPMANDDRGAYWFSNEEEIRNPYFGDVMLACGENREIIK